MKIETYKLFLDVEEGVITPEEAQVQLLKLLDTVYKADPNIYKGKDLKTCPLGLYMVYWSSGGSSYASIGNLHDGTRWIAPINWTDKINPTGKIDDDMVKDIDHISILFKN